MSIGLTVRIFAAVALVAAVPASWAGAPAPDTREVKLPRACQGCPDTGEECSKDADCKQGTCELDLLRGPHTRFPATVTIIVDDDVSQFDNSENVKKVVAVTTLLEVVGPEGRPHVLAQTYQNLKGATLDDLVKSLKAGPFIADTVLSGGGCGSGSGGGTGGGGGMGGGGQLEGNRVTEPCLNDRTNGGKILRDLLLQQGDQATAHAVRQLLGAPGPLVIVRTPDDVAEITYDNHRDDGLATVVRMNVTLQAVDAEGSAGPTPDTCEEDETCGGGTGPCAVSVDSPAGTFTNLQKAIDAAHDGATISVTGVCPGPVVITRRHDLTIEGVAPAFGGCPADGLQSGDLVATITARAGDREAVKVIRSSNITLRFLNLIDSRTQGVELELTDASALQCNCIGRNGEGVEVEGGKSNAVADNVVLRNAADGVRLHANTTGNMVSANRVHENGDDGIELEPGSSANVIADNVVDGNHGDGIDLNDADGNRVLRNRVEDNGRVASRDSGIELGSSDRNVVDANDIAGNADGLTDQARCESSTGNSGDNVPSRCR